MKISINNKLVIFLSLLSFISFLSGAILFKYTKEISFNGDESGWITSGYYYTDLLFKHDFDWDKWSCTKCGPWGNLNPHVGKWLIGIPLKVHSNKIGGREFFKFYDFTKSLQDNRKEGRIPPRDILLYARNVSAIFAVLCCLLIFAISYFCMKSWIGMIAVILLLANKLFIVSTTRAMTDVYYNFFLLCFCLAVIFLLKLRKETQMLWVSLLCGSFTGLACSVKITGIIIGGFIFLALIIYKGNIFKLRKKMIVLYSIVFFFSSIAVIYILNPYFWPSYKEIKGKAIFQELKSISEEKPTIKLPRGGIGDLIGKDIRERYPQLSNLSHVLEFPLLFIRWNNFQNRIATGESGIPIEFRKYWYGNRFRTFHKTLFIEHSSFVSVANVFLKEGTSYFSLLGIIEWIFLCIGIISCCIRINKSVRCRNISLWTIPLLYFITNYFFILIFQNLSFDRYYLPTIIASRVIVAVGIYDVMTRIYQYFKGSRQRVLLGY